MTTALFIASAISLAVTTLPLDGTWQFARFKCGAGPETASAVSNEAWQTVSVPHDWAIGGPFTPGKDTGCGALPWKADGWYRRSFDLTAAEAKTLAAGGRAYLEFDGVMARPKVFVNGTCVGGWDYGYMSFAVDATSALKLGSNNLAVFATTRHHASRWYPGGGIYRSVRLVVKPADHVLPNSVFITTPFVSATSATVRVTWEMAKGGRRERTHVIRNPKLWSFDSPHLYEMDVEGETYRYGIRTFAFTADDGFHLNGRRVQLNGVDLHSDLGPLGMAFDRDAMKRQLLAMRDMGVNAIRTSHNAPAPGLLELADEMGFFVWDECFDRWEWFAGRRCDQEPLEEFCIRNLQAFVRRDRNHPSVFVWSIGNEIPPADGKYPHGMTGERCAAFRDAIRAIDPTRPVGVGACDLPLLEKPILDALDLTGWNYERKYARMKEKYPTKPVLYSESASAVSSRGHYSNPPSGTRTAWDVAARELDSYDHNAAPWSDMPDPEFWRMEKDRFCGGEFVWTGIDYLGEPTPLITWFEAVKCIPDAELPRSSYFGICDLTCTPKDRFYLYRSHWNKDKTTVHLLPHWNWRPEDLARMPGKQSNDRVIEKSDNLTVPVYLYTNGDEAELFLNGKSLGRRQKQEVADYPLDMDYPQGEDVRLAGVEAADFRTNSYFRICDRYRLRWLDVPYEPGELKAVAYRNGEEIGETVVRTSGKPVAVRLTEDPYNADDADLRFVQVDLVDEEGTHDPLATNRVAFTVSGGEIVSVGNGNPRGAQSFKDVSGHSLYFGRAVVAVRVPRGGTATLKATSERLCPAELRMVSRNTLEHGFRDWCAEFAADDVEIVTNAVSNAEAADFLASRVPFFECPDRDVERAYAFRWWSLRKHFFKALDGWCVSEFTDTRAIACPVGHHFMEGRWLGDEEIFDDYAKYWFEEGANPIHGPGSYVNWIVQGILAREQVTGNAELANGLLEAFVANYEAWEKGWGARPWPQEGTYEMGLKEDGLFHDVDDREGTELTLSGNGARPHVNAMMYGEAKAIAKIAARCGKQDVAEAFEARAAKLEKLVKEKLWNAKQKFFCLLKDDGTLSDVCELHGYSPWYAGMPLGGKYAAAWRWLSDAKRGFCAPKGLTFPTLSTPGFRIAYEGHACQWNGPSWPYATSVALTALNRVLRGDGAPKGIGISHDYHEAFKEVWLEAFLKYARQHRQLMPEGYYRPWVDEVADPFTGDWVAYHRWQRESCRNYNHSTFCDLVISGLVGLEIAEDGSFAVKPNVPESWDWFRLENVPLRGRRLTVVYDRYGTRYGRGRGLRVNYAIISEQ